MRNRPRAYACETAVISSQTSDPEYSALSSDGANDRDQDRHLMTIAPEPFRRKADRLFRRFSTGHNSARSNIASTSVRGLRSSTIHPPRPHQRQSLLPANLPDRHPRSRCSQPASLSDPHSRRRAEPEEVAAAILFLASPAASMITGHTLVVDGGYLAP